MNGRGYVRLKSDFHPQAVSWWFFDTFDDGFSFARGGRVRTARDARKQIRAASDAAHSEHRHYLERPTHRLQADGSLDEIVYPDRLPFAMR